VPKPFYANHQERMRKLREKLMNFEERLKQLGLELIDPPAPIHNLVLTVQSGNLLFVSGHKAQMCPELENLQSKVGSDGNLRVGRDLSVEEGYMFARYTALSCLSSIKAAVGDLDRVTRIVKVFGMVNSSENFIQQPQVINGCSDLLVELFGEAGKHARSAVGMQALPSGIPVEIEMIVEIC
jgi:enamine deaminase RidA (YjgF/YER057c/UK114 family)